MAVALTCGAVLAHRGLGANLLQLQVSAAFLLANGLLLMLGLASSASTIAMASPRVGNHHDVSAGRWPGATLASLLTAFLLLVWLRRGAPAV